MMNSYFVNSNGPRIVVLLTTMLMVLILPFLVFMFQGFSGITNPGFILFEFIFTFIGCVNFILNGMYYRANFDNNNIVLSRFSKQFRYNLSEVSVVSLGLKSVVSNSYGLKINDKVFEVKFVTDSLSLRLDTKKTKSLIEGKLNSSDIDIHP